MTDRPIGSDRTDLQCLSASIFFKKNSSIDRDFHPIEIFTRSRFSPDRDFHPIEIFTPIDLDRSRSYVRSSPFVSGESSGLFWEKKTKNSRDPPIYPRGRDSSNRRRYSCTVTLLSMTDDIGRMDG